MIEGGVYLRAAFNRVNTVVLTSSESRDPLKSNASVNSSGVYPLPRGWTLVYPLVFFHCRENAGTAVWCLLMGGSAYRRHPLMGGVHHGAFVNAIVWGFPLGGSGWAVYFT